MSSFSHDYGGHFSEAELMILLVSIYILIVIDF